MAPRPTDQSDRRRREQRRLRLGLMLVSAAAIFYAALTLWDALQQGDAERMIETTTAEWHRQRRSMP